MSSFLFSLPQAESPGQARRSPQPARSQSDIVHARVARARATETIPLKEGYLTKQGGGSWGLWQKRWYSLLSDVITYSDSDHGKIKGGILVEAIVEVRTTTASESWKPHSFIIRTDTDRGDYIQSAANDVEMQAWIDAIRRICKGSRPASPVATRARTKHHPVLHPWLEMYKTGLVTEDAAAMASMFHSQLQYVVNGQHRLGGERLATEGTWKQIFARVKYVRVEALNVSVEEGNTLCYTEVVSVQLRETGEVMEAIFVDKSVLTNKGTQVIAVKRVCSHSVYDTFDRWLTPTLTDKVEDKVFVYHGPTYGHAGAVFRMLEEAHVSYHHFSEPHEIKVMASKLGAASTVYEPPIIVDGPHMVSGSIPTCVYIGRRCGFAPSESNEPRALQFMQDVQRLLVDEMVQRAKHGGAASLLAFLEGRPPNETSDNVNAAGKTTTDTESPFSVLATTIERQIQGPFVFGERPTYADFYLTQVWDVAHAWGMGQVARATRTAYLAPFAKIARIARGIRALPSYMAGPPMPTLRPEDEVSSHVLAALGKASHPGGRTDPELVTFAVSNFATLPRLCFHLGGCRFKDTAIPRDEWEGIRTNESAFPFGRLPVLRHEGWTISDPAVIAEYAATYALTAHHAHLVSMEHAINAMLVGVYNDMTVANARASPTHGGDASQRGSVTTQLLRQHFSPIERMLRDGDGDEVWLHGGSTPTLGDLAVFAMATYCHAEDGPRTGWSELVPGWESAYPKIAACRDRVRGLDGLSSYFDHYGVLHR
eukprot:m.214277 g.214277  ORF g.214277 m.214277 type:complete len:767 (+) comp27087_c0_seq1:91-2391(+)